MSQYSGEALWLLEQAKQALLDIADEIAGA